MKFTLYIHVGSGKAGSSSIQRALRENKDALSNSNTKYVGMMFENIKPIEHEWQKPYGWPIFQEDIKRQKEQLKDKLKKEINNLKENNFKSAIWSNESLFSEVELVKEIKEMGRENDFNVKVICYFRNHVSWIISAYKQWGIKHKAYTGKIKSFEEWGKTRKAQFSFIAKKWKENFNQDFMIKNFDIEDNLVNNFFRYCEIESPSIKTEKPHENKAPEDIPLALWGIYNNQFESEVLPNEFHPFLKRAGLLDKQIKGLNYENLLPNTTQINELKNEYQEDLNKINTLLEEAGEPTLSFPENKKTDNKISHFEIVAALLVSIEKHDREIRQLKRKIKQLENK